MTDPVFYVQGDYTPQEDSAWLGALSNIITAKITNVITNNVSQTVDFIVRLSSPQDLVQFVS